MAAAATFSSRCPTFEVPGIGSMTGCVEQPGPICPVSPSALAVAASVVSGFCKPAGAEGKPGDEADVLFLAVVEHGFGWRGRARL